MRNRITRSLRGRLRQRWKLCEKEKVMVMVNTERPALEEAVIDSVPANLAHTSAYDLINENGTSTEIYFLGVSEPIGPYVKRSVEIVGFGLRDPDRDDDEEARTRRRMRLPKTPCYLALLRSPMPSERKNSNPHGIAEGLEVVERIGSYVRFRKTGQKVDYVPIL